MSSGSAALFWKHPSACVRAIAMVAFAAGIGVWGALLFAPVVRGQPPALGAISAPAHDTAALAQWFGGAAMRVRIAALGVIASEDRGAALLSVNGGPPRAYRVGQALAPGVTLAAVGPLEIAIDQDGVIEQVAMPVSSASRVRGFLPAPVTAASASAPR